jgi:hypothetical protein
MFLELSFSTYLLSLISASDRWARSVASQDMSPEADPLRVLATASSNDLLTQRSQRMIVDRALA